MYHRYVGATSKTMASEATDADASAAIMASVPGAARVLSSTPASAVVAAVIYPRRVNSGSYIPARCFADSVTCKPLYPDQSCGVAGSYVTLVHDLVCNDHAAVAASLNVTTPSVNSAPATWQESTAGQLRVPQSASNMRLKSEVLSGKSATGGVGASVGDTVGDAVGDAEGSFVGDAEGSFVGDAEGSFVGDAEGSFVGDAEVSFVGDAEGASEGDAEGSFVGDAEGSFVGAKVCGASILTK
jgi:hypothetical protein